MLNANAAHLLATRNSKQRALFLVQVFAGLRWSMFRFTRREITAHVDGGVR